MTNVTTKNSSCKAIIFKYYIRRAQRLFPIYGLGLAVSVAIARHAQHITGGAHIIYQNWFYGCPRRIWMNFLFINNRGIPTGCSVAYWSLAISFQFYICFPIMLCLLRPTRTGFNRLLYWGLAVLLVISTACRVWFASLAQTSAFPVGFTIANPLAIQRLFSWLKYIYYPSLGRMTAPVVGAALGTLLRNPSAMKKFSEKRYFVSVFAFAAEIGAIWAAAQPWHGSEKAWPMQKAVIFGALLHNGSILMSTAVALSMLAMILEADPMHGALARLFSTPIFAKLADFSLGFYFFHTQVWYFWLQALEKSQWWGTLLEERPGAALAVASVGVVAGGFLAAIAYDALEKGVKRILKKKALKKEAPKIA